MTTLNPLNPNFELNNLNNLLPYLEFFTGDDFYFLQIIKRRRENPDMVKSEKLIKTYHITSEQHLIDKFEEIKSICKFHNARAYLDLNKKSFEQTAIIVLDKIAKCFANRTYKSIKSAYDSACGSHTAEQYPLWIVDVDIKNDEIVSRIAENIRQCDSNCLDPVVGFIPTINGVHILTHKFNRKQFEPYQCIDRCDVIKHGMTLLYYGNE